jgi:hypothetical protein
MLVNAAVRLNGTLEFVSRNGTTGYDKSAFIG